MNTVSYISLDIQRQQSQGSVQVMVGDTARSLCFLLHEQGTPFAVQEDVRPVLAARKPDGTLLFQDCKLEKGRILYAFDPQISAVSGTVFCELRLYGQDGKLLISPRFSLLVTDTVFHDGDVVESSSEFSALNSLIAETLEIREAWEKLLEEGGLGAVPSGVLQGFDEALQIFFDSDIAGLPVAYRNDSGRFGFMNIVGLPENEKQFWLPTIGTVEEMLAQGFQDLTEEYEQAVGQGVSSVKEYLWTLPGGSYMVRIRKGTNIERIYYLRAFAGLDGQIGGRVLYEVDEFTYLSLYLGNHPGAYRAPATLHIDGETCSVFFMGTDVDIFRKGAGGLEFDSGFVDDRGYFHLTAGGVEIPEFVPFYIGSASETADDLVLEGEKLYLSRKGVTMGQGVTLPKGGGGASASGSVLKLLSSQGSQFSVMDSATEALILYSWSSVDSEDGSSTGKGSASWYVNDKRVAGQSVEQGEQSFDILPFLESGVENTVKLTLEDAYGATRSRLWTVTLISFGLSWDLEDMACHESAPMAIRLIPNGMGDKTLRVWVDGVLHSAQTVSTTGRTVTVELPALSHGAHVIEASVELTAEGQSIATEPLRHVGIWAEEGNNLPVVTFYEEEVQIPQYATASLRYLVYDPLTETAVVELWEDQSVSSTLSVGRGMQIWPYRPTVQEQLNLAIREPVTGEHDILQVEVTPLGYDIAPVTAGLVLECSPAGHSNSEGNRGEFGYTDHLGENHPFLFSEHFDWTNGGFLQDEEGVTALLIKRGSSVTLDRSFFDKDATAKGKEIKLILKCDNCKNYEATFLSCVQNGVGLILKAQEGILSSESQSLCFPYCEEKKLEIDLNISSAKEQCLATVWLEGIPTGAFAYASTDSWVQGSPTPVVIGSQDCDVWLYGIRLYENGLTQYDILSNFVADAGSTEDMIARYERNDIYKADGTISLSKLAIASPDLRILHITAPRMTTSKTDEVTCKVELSHNNGMSFTAEGVIMKAQGTSSLEYGLAALNLDLDFSQAKWTDEEGKPLTAFAMTEAAVPVNYFNIKLNVASSENANNVCLAEDYNNFNPFRAEPRASNLANAEAVQKLRDTVEGHGCAVFLTNSSNATIAVGARSLASGDTMLYGCGDMNNSKKNFAVFGQDNSLYPEQCCVEILNNNNDPCRFKSDDLRTETWDGAEGTSNFEFRYPKSPSEAMKQKFQNLLSWVVSTDPQQATGQALGRPAQYGGVTYNTDTADYRRAKFRGELGNWFSVDSLLFHYLFTEYHLMVDNRAKNCFVSYEYDPKVGDYRWNFNKDYDNDTAAGTDNSGGLTFRYGLEDTDSVGAQKVFNASDSVLWCNLRDTMGQELKAMFHSLESQGLWDTERILEQFRRYQSCRPESLVAEDMWGKYFTPYLNKGEKRYLEMAQGTKEDQRTAFYTYQRPYLSSKYRSSYATSESLSLRINEVSDFTLTPYSDMYACVKFGNASLVELRAKSGEEILIPCEADTTNDLETYIYCAGSISRIGDLSGLQTSEIELNSARKLLNLPLGSQTMGYENNDLTQLSFGTIRNLEQIDLTGLSKLTGTLDLRQFDALREFYASGSGITGVNFAPNAPLEEVALPQVGTMILRGLRKLRRLRVDCSKLLNLRLEDCPTLDSLSMLRQAKDLQRGRVTAVHWDDADGDTLLRLSSLGGYDEEGRATDHFVLTGYAYVPVLAQEELERLHSSFPNLELEAGQIVPCYTVTFQNHDGSILTTQRVRKGGTALDPVSAGLIPTPEKEPTEGQTFRFAGWDFPLTDVQGDRVLTAVFASAVRKYTVRWFDGSRLLQTDTVEAYDAVKYRGQELSSTEEDVLWIGWDKEEQVKEVKSDLDVYATYLSPILPDAVAMEYDYLYSDDPLDKSAYTLGEFYGIVHYGKGEEYFSAGDEIKLCTDSENFTDREIVMQLFGFKHFPLAKGEGFANAVFGMKGIMNGKRTIGAAATGNKGGWADCSIRKFLRDTVFPDLPQRWKAMIKKVQVCSSVGGTSIEIGISEDRLFLFAPAELGHNTTVVPYSQEVDPGAQSVTFPLFTDNASRVKKTANGKGSAETWYTRSPEASLTGAFWTVSASGSLQYSNVATQSGVCFGFCI